MSVYTGDATKMATSVKNTQFSLFSCTSLGQKAFFIRKLHYNKIPIS